MRIANGARLVTGARVHAASRPNARGLATGAVWLDDDGREHFQAASVVVLAANAIGTARLLLLSSSNAIPTVSPTRAVSSGTRLMMHPFASVTGLFDDDLESWQGHFGCSIESFEFYETDERRGFVRGAKWGLAPTGGPINAALPSRAGEQVWGPDHHLHDAGPLRARRELGAVRRGPARPVQPRDAVGRRSPTRPGFRLPSCTTRCRTTPVGCSTSTSTRRPSRSLAAGAHTVEVDRLMRYSGWHLLGTARMGDDPATSVLDEWNRSHDVANLYVVDGSCFVTSGGVNPTSTICALALRAADHLVRDPFRSEGARMNR